MKLKFLHTLLITLITTIVTAQVTFEGTVNKKRIAINERLQVSFTVNKDGDNFRAPSFNGFKANGPSQSVSRQWTNGKSSYQKSFTYVLTPQQKGKFTIGQATIEVDGNTYKTSPITITVTGSVANPSGGENPDYVADKKVHLVARVSNSNPYLNEAVTLEYILYWENSVGLFNPQLNEMPKFRDFWSQEIDLGQQLKPKQGTYKGVPSNYVVYKKYVMYPQKTGKLKLSPISMTVPVQVPTNKRDFFGRRVNNTVNKTVTAGNTVLNVKALPQNAPESFTGAVGNFSFIVTQSKASLNATESLQVNLKVSGNGNLKLFKLPELKVPSAIEKYDPEHKESVRVRSKGMTGSISDNYTLVPQYKGKFPLPNITFSFFDPKTASYKTLGSRPIAIDVLQGPTEAIANTQNNTAITNNETQEEVEATKNQQFRFIKSEANLQTIKQPQFFKTTLFWCLLLLPLLTIPLFLLISKRNESLAGDIEGSKARRASKLAKKHLSKAKKDLGDSKAFYVSLEKALHNYLKSRLKIETSEMNKDNIQSLLQDKEVSAAAISKFKEVLETCDMARYTPNTLQTMTEDFEKASDVISLIDKQL